MLKMPVRTLCRGGVFVCVAGDAGWSSPVARKAHNLRVKSSNFFFQAEDGIRDKLVTGVQTCALPIFDVIHCHVDYLAYPFSGLVSTPTLHTVHGRLDLPYLTLVYRQFKHVPLVSISDAQRTPLADIGVTWAGTVHHGLAPERFTFSPTPGAYLAFLGRLSPEKQPDVAIEVAKRAGLPLRIAAKVDAADQEYFDRAVAPLLDHPLIEFIGEIGDADKAAFLGGARALLFPIDW